MISKFKVLLSQVLTLQLVVSMAVDIYLQFFPFHCL